MITNLASFFFHQIQEAEHEANRVYEPMIGVVTDNKDPEKLMRVKVKLPVLSMDDTTWWIPVVSLGAGKERGWFFLPEVDDEVLVAFEHGDINRPVVIGALWNGQDKPPEQQSSSNGKRLIVSRGGSRIEIDDEANTIVLKDGGGKAEITIKADDNTMVIEAKQGDVDISCPTGDLVLLADQGIEMTGQLNFDVRGKQNVNVGGKGGLTLKGSAMMSLTGGQTNLAPGGVPAPAEGSTSPEDVPDPVGG